MEVTSTYRIEVLPIVRGDNITNNKWVQTAHQIGLTTLTGILTTRVFFVSGRLNKSQARQICEELIADPVTETYTIDADSVTSNFNSKHRIDITLLPGVTDPIAENLIRAAHLLDIDVRQAATGHRYYVEGDLSPAALETLATRVFSNPVIQRHAIDSPISPPFISRQINDNSVETISICAADHQELLRISRERRLALDIHEMQAIQAYYRQENREPTDVELETLAQTWSEHCVHKTFKAQIDYTGPAHGAAPDSEPVTQYIDSLFKTYIQKATVELDKDWLRSVFVDNAGIFKFNDKWDIAFKAETHNHPSALEPFGGANTGVGGVIRDILGVSARPIANTDILCFGYEEIAAEHLPEGVLHPRRIADGVIHGVEDYGNKMGIPTVNGAIHYHKGYTANPLVFCGCVGILPHGSHRTEANPGDLIVVIGGRTGRDGLRGATFSSMEMDTTTSEIASVSVQIGHPINEKQVLEVILQARDEALYSAITDCGAGGLSSAIGEMGEKIGARVQLQDVPLKYPGLRPWEIWLSEAQERMVLAIPPTHWERLQSICAEHNVEAVAIGTFENTGHLRLHYAETVVGDLAMEFLHDGIPTRHLKAEWTPPQTDNTGYETHEIEDSLLKLLAHPNLRSKEGVVRRYDHEVQAGTTIKPFVGINEHGPSDATVLIPLDTVDSGKSSKGIALSNGICPQYTELDPYAMAWAAVDEAMRNLIAVGTDPDQVAILDNFCWGNPNLPDRLGALVRCSQGLYDAAIAYGVPLISGKDSLNNEYMGEDGQRHAIPGTLLISAIGIVPDVQKTATMDLKRAGSRLYLIGNTYDELGGSHYNLIHNISSGTVPQPNTDGLKTLRTLYQAINKGLILASHDVSEGGIAVALAEMCIAGQLGAAVQISDMPAHQWLFSESISRFIVEVSENQASTFEGLLQANGTPCSAIGRVKEQATLSVGFDNTSIDIDLNKLTQAFLGHIQSDAVKFEPKIPLATPKPVPSRAAVNHITPPRVLILHANGTNRDREAALACEIAGGAPEIIHLNQLLSNERNLLDYHMLLIPGGFSYGDDLGAGMLWAADLRHRLYDNLQQFVRNGRPVLGICNGFQVLVKSGLLPGIERDGKRSVTLTYNELSQFECRWVHLKANSNSPSLFTEGIDDLIYCPVAHGEGRVAVGSDEARQTLWDQGLVALTYVDALGQPTGYPGNPNGSVDGIAALCNPAGNVMGLMPHPEDHIFSWQHPRWHRGENGNLGLKLFQNGIKYA